MNRRMVDITCESVSPHTTETPFLGQSVKFFRDRDDKTLMLTTIGLVPDWLLYIAPLVGVTVLVCLAMTCNALEARIRREEIQAEVMRRREASRPSGQATSDEGHPGPDQES